jgi:signal transduction histidine kinase/CheY-like chemotaxis protein
VAEIFTECLSVIEKAEKNNEFFAHMSHELRTPFHGVMSSLYILQSGNTTLPEEERKEVVECALDSGKSMLQTLDDILTIAKSKNCTSLITSPVNISKIIRSTARILHSIAETKSIHFEAIEGDNRYVLSHILKVEDWRSLIVLGDETRIVQIANNLTSNAIKFTPVGGKVTLKVTLKPFLEVVPYWNSVKSKYRSGHIASDNKQMVDTSGKADTSKLDSILDTSILTLKNDDNNGSVWVILEIEDTGCGVSEDSMKIMFNAYQQVSSGVSKTYQGTGLGLHIVRLHTEIMNGAVGVTSTPGIGTTMFCCFPIKPINELKLDFRSLNLSKENLSNDNLKAISDIVSSASRKMSPNSNPVTVVERVPNKNNNNNNNTTLSRSKLHVRNIITESRVKDEQKTHLIQEIETVKKVGIFMLVDDSKINLRLTERIITMHCGVSALCKLSYDGLEAIQQYKEMIESGTQEQLALILMDYHMPNCTGLQAIEAIRQIEKQCENLHHPAYIVGFTADLSEERNRMVINAGADEVMPKPTPNDMLVSVCNKLLKTTLQRLGK